MSDVNTKTEVAVARPPKPPLVGGGRIAAIVPQDIESVFRLAQVVHAAGMAPKSLDSVEKCTVAIMHGLEVGFTPMAALQSIAVVNGMPSIWGDGMIALVRASGLLEDIVETIEDDKDGPTIAVCKVKRVGSPSWVMQTFTRPQAMKAGLWRKQGPWMQYPQRMMQMRARSWALRDAFPDVLRGLNSAEEAIEMVDVTSRGSATTAPPEPRRSDYVYAGNGAATEKEPDPPHDAQTGELKPTDPPADPWLAIGDDQQQIGASMSALLDNIRSLDDVAKFDAANKENLEKSTEQIRRRVTRDLNEIRKSLGGA
jgi:hypothetical protein